MESIRGATGFKRRIAIDIVPFLLSAIFIGIRVVIATRFSEVLVQATCLTADSKSGYILLCFGIWRWFLLCLLNKQAVRCVVLWFPPNHVNGARHLARSIYPPCDKSDTCYTTNMWGLTAILITHFTYKIKLITLLNERGWIPPLRFGGQFTLHSQQKVSDDKVAWWSYNKHKPLTQNTLRKRTQNTSNWSQRSSAHHKQCSVP